MMDGSKIMNPEEEESKGQPLLPDPDKKDGVSMFSTTMRK